MNKFEKAVVDAARDWREANRDGFYGGGRGADHLRAAVDALDAAEAQQPAAVPECPTCVGEQSPTCPPCVFGLTGPAPAPTEERCTSACSEMHTFNADCVQRADWATEANRLSLEALEEWKRAEAADQCEPDWHLGLPYAEGCSVCARKG
jgi:hypothetical protein